MRESIETPGTRGVARIASGRGTGKTETRLANVIAHPTYAARNAAEPGVDLADGEIHYRELFNAIDRGFCIVEVMFDQQDHPFDYRFLEVNAAFETQTGLQKVVGKTMRSFRADHEAHWFEILGAVASTGESIRFERPAAALGRWFDVFAFRTGRPEQRRVALLFEDITQHKRTEEHRAMLQAETRHRAGNLFTVVQCMVQLTRADTVSEYRMKLMGRISALANAQRHLAAECGRNVVLSQLVKEEMAAFALVGDGLVAWDGPGVTLAPIEAQSVVLALHELATNATKHGALSVPDGRVSLNWLLRDDGRLQLCWCESGGPRLEGPIRFGLGTRIIRHAIESQLQGEVVFHWRPDGVGCELVVPVETVQA